MAEVTEYGCGKCQRKLMCLFDNQKPTCPECGSAMFRLVKKKRKKT